VSLWILSSVPSLIGYLELTHFALAIEANTRVIINPKKMRCITPPNSVHSPTVRCLPTIDCTSSRMSESDP